MFAKKNPMSVFYDGYIERNPFKWLKRFGRQWKWAYQRMTRGYSDCDTWHISDWFLMVMPAMLEQFAENLHSYPIGEPTEAGELNIQQVVLTDADEDMSEKWKNVLLDMAKAFRDADETTCSMKNQYEEAWLKAYEEFDAKFGIFGEKLEPNDAKPAKQMHFPSEFPEWEDVMKKYRDEDIAISKFRQQRLLDGLALFKKWFWDLID